jgi:hypothetical protein
MKPIDHLKELLKQKKRIKYPSIPEHALEVNTFDKMKPEKREKKRIEAFLNATGNYGAIIENRGQRMDNRKVVSDILGRQKVIGSVDFIGSGMRKGIADIKATIQGRAVDIELKRIYKNGKDRQSEHQKKEQEMIESAGGQYWIVTSFDDFYQKYKKFLESL